MKSYLVRVFKMLIFCCLFFLIFSGFSQNNSDKQYTRPGVADVDDYEIITYVGKETKFKGYATSFHGRIIKHTWDFDGDGIVDWESEKSGIAIHTYIHTVKQVNIEQYLRLMINRILWV